ncbi:sonic hedgehog protein A [Lingula anatina]|uniref:Hedgehog protein n=1 Tax=Lingula anatina TaxID=7574 RepID=A0A1S3IAV3_LINAN|nr:sonic hedgehog protein A [Lingula anatina]XP_013395298.1 sonic hedgehog protein A [Lingula anatina]XP_013395299.1 sonic hedgehog protein A [Lingula anatina]|eukprot:XP_013395296.1 sonic hedgehog protein A [Lingula anatina]
MGTMYKVSQLCQTLALIFLLLTQPSVQCGPGRGSGRRGKPKKLTPLVFKQQVPNVSENTLGASGPAEGKITESDPRYKDLKVNYNPDIVFRDEEGTGEDRIMTQRCKDKLNSLAISVMVRWPGVKLRVTEAYDTDEQHSKDSLHYEGRAVDITTSDRDRAKYGMLARLAVESGFDWVYYQNRGHIHCSVKSDSAAAVHGGGCFDASGQVTLEDGHRIPMSELKIGQRVLTADSNGNLHFSEVMIFLDRRTDHRGLYYTLQTADGGSISLTHSHMIFVSSTNASSDTYSLNKKAIFARDAQVGQYLYRAHETTGHVRLSQIVKIEPGWREGAYAPLTKHGTIVVDDTLASCYGVINSQNIAHMAFVPARWMHTAKNFAKDYLNIDWKQSMPQNGMHWYSKLLFKISPYVLGESLLFQP